MVSWKVWMKKPILTDVHNYYLLMPYSANVCMCACMTASYLLFLWCLMFCILFISAVLRLIDIESDPRPGCVCWDSSCISGFWIEVSISDIQIQELLWRRNRDKQAHCGNPVCPLCLQPRRAAGHDCVSLGCCPTRIVSEQLCVLGEGLMRYLLCQILIIFPYFVLW